MDNDGSKKTRVKALRLQHLPPDILLAILSRLEFKEAARMSILSHKWRRFWRCYENLVFTRETMFNSGSNAVRNRHKFISNVNSVLRQLRSTILKKFVVRFKLRKRQARHVDRWVSFAAKSKTRHITFDFSPGSWYGDHGNRYIFPLHNFSGSNGSSVRSLRLMFLCLNPPPNFCGFTNLKKLKLNAVSVPGHLRCLLPECAVLEWLSIVRCTLDGLQTSQPLYRLRYLRVQHCKGMQKVEIQAPNLVVFKFDDSPMPIVLNGCLALAEATVVALSWSDCFSYAFTELPSGIPHVRKLNMELIMFIDSKGQEFTKCPTVFFNLRHLVLTIEMFYYHTTGGITRLAYLLELAPVLEELELHMQWPVRGQSILGLEDILPQRPHNHLKVLKMTGVYSYKSLFDLVFYIARSAAALQHVIIVPMVKRNYTFTRDEEVQFAIGLGRKMAKQHFQGKGFDGILTIL